VEPPPSRRTRAHARPSRANAPGAPAARPPRWPPDRGPQLPPPGRRRRARAHARPRSPQEPHQGQRGYIILAPLPPTARAAVLQFDAPGGPPGPGGGETIRVPLGPHTLTLRRLAHPRATARAAGLTLTLQELGVAHLIYTYTLRSGIPYSGGPRQRPPPSAPPDPFAPLLAADGRPLPAAARGTACATAPHGLRCAITVVFPPQPPGTRLTLTIRAVQLGNPFAPTTQHPLPGPWRLPATVP